jgi:hypothetical protein
MTEDKAEKAKTRHVSEEEIDEFSFALEQAARLQRVLQFLQDHGADEELMDAVEQALVDNEFYVDPDLAVLGSA